MHSVISGHIGRNALFGTVRGRYFFREMYKNVSNWVASCIACGERKSPEYITRAELQPIPCVGPFFRVQWYLQGPYPKSPICNCQLLIIEGYTGKNTVVTLL